MQTNLVKLLLLFALIPVLKGSRTLWKLNKFAPVERTVKSILESCYENDKSSSPIVIFGDFNEFIDKPSIIRINKFLSINNNTGFVSKANRVVLVGNSPEQLESDLKFFRKTEWWDHMASFFIIAKHTQGCGNFKEILNTTWTMDIINSIYICAESTNTSMLYTLNLMANYAPLPWKRMEELNNSNVFRQVFNQSISCKNLHFNKTKYLTRYEIKVVRNATKPLGLFPPKNGSGLVTSESLSAELLQTVVTFLNASATVEDVINRDVLYQRLQTGRGDILHHRLTSLKYPGCYALSYVRERMIGVVKLEPEITTLHKISKLWSIPVLMVAAIALTFLFFILMIKNHDFGLAMLDVVRLLTYTSIRTNVQTHTFRIYFTTMLIFMVISNGVFQGKIAAFLTTRERASAIGTINELADLGYNMFAVGSSKRRFNEQCPKCDFKSASPQECIEHVLNKSHHLCAIWERLYIKEFSKDELDYIPKALRDEFSFYRCREYWPLANRFNDGLSRLFQAGIIDYMQRKRVYVPQRKRMATEAERSSAQYRPVKLYKLKFAFQGLAFGLLLSIIVFICEIHQGYYETI